MILGIDLGGTNIRIGQVTEGRLIRKISRPSPADMPLERSLDYLKAVIGEMFTDEVESIGIGVPSALDIAEGVVYNVVNIPSWKEVPLKEIFSEAFGVPVYINNDANCFVLGEKQFGQGRNFRNIVGVTLGTGVGAGLIINDRLYGGRNTGAGEIGSLPYRDATLEDWCSSNFFVRRHHTTGEEAAARARAGDTSAMKIWEEFGEHIGAMIELILYTYDPELILFGGGIAQAGALFAPAMRERIRRFPYPQTVKNIRIAVTQNADTPVLGAASLAIHKIANY